jgi:hypothetical protein
LRLLLSLVLSLVRKLILKVFLALRLRIDQEQIRYDILGLARC